MIAYEPIIPCSTLGQVHRSTLAAEYAVLASEQLGHRGPGSIPRASEWAWPAVRGERVVVGLHCRPEAGCDRLHAQGEMGGSLDEVLQEQVVCPLPELPRAPGACGTVLAGLEVDVGVVEDAILRLGEPWARAAA